MSLKGIFAALSRNASSILTVTSVIGVISTAISASSDTVYAKELLKDELGVTNISRAIKTGKVTKKEVVVTTWKCYIPTFVIGSLTIASIIGSHYLNSKQKIALSNAYILSQTTLQEYQRKVAERLGERKEREIRNEVRRSIADQQAPPINYISDRQNATITGHGNSLFYDVPEGEYFYSDIHFLERSRNEINDRLISGHEPYIDQNEIRAEWGLSWKKFGSENVITPSHLLDISIEPELMENGDVRLLLDYNLYPKSEVLAR